MLRLNTIRIPVGFGNLMRILANQIAEGIKRELAAGVWPHCAVYESDLQRIWSLNEEDRQKKIVQFATEYGFELRYYKEGLCAIFVKAS
jgi:hypothetical protein